MTCWERDCALARERREAARGWQRDGCGGASEHKGPRQLYRQDLAREWRMMAKSGARTGVHLPHTATSRKSDAGPGSLPPQEQPSCGPGCSLSRWHVSGKGVHRRGGCVSAWAHSAHLLGKNFQRPLLPPAPQSQRAPRITAEETSTLPFVSFRFFKTPEASDSSLEIRAQTTCWPPTVQPGHGVSVRRQGLTGKS